MACKVLSTYVLDRIEKFLCADGGWETICHAAHLTGNRACIIKNISSTIECLLKRHPGMRTRLRVESNRYLLDFLDYNSEYLSSSLFFSIIDSNEYSWQEIVEIRCNRNPYTNDETLIFPLFHFVLLFNSESSKSEERFHLLLFENHCASDGRSGLILINDFLTLVTSSNLNSMSEPINVNILPQISSLIPRPFGPLYGLLSKLGKRILKRTLRKLNQPRIPIKLSPLPDSSSNQFQVPRYHTKFLFSTSSPDLYSKLHKQCQMHETTLNGPLLACFLLAIHHCFPKGDYSRLKPLEFGVAFDMRSRLPGSPLTTSSIGFFIAVSEIGIRRSLSIRSTRFWTLAKKCMETTRNQFKSSGIPLVMNILSDICQNERTFREMTRLCPDGRLGELGFSNIGKYPFPCEYNQGELRLRGLHVINNTSLYRTSTIMFATCAGDGQLDFSLAHEIESDEQAKQFLDVYMRLIEASADDILCHPEITLNNFLQQVTS